MIKKLILFLLVTLISFNVSFANEKGEEMHVEQFNTVRVEIPSIIRFEKSDRYSIEIYGEKNYLYRIALKDDTLEIAPYFVYDNLQQINPEDLIVVLRHPNPRLIMQGLIINNSTLKQHKKSGSLKK
jgi:hypothetical protein